MFFFSFSFKEYIFLGALDKWTEREREWGERQNGESLGREEQRES